MPFMVIDGHKMKIDDNTFDTMSQLVQDELQTSSEEQPTKKSRWRDDGTYDNRPLDPDYFKRYYQNKLKTPMTCPDCGKTIANKSNMSKHRNTKKCRSSQTC